MKKIIIMLVFSLLAGGAVLFFGTGERFFSARAKNFFAGIFFIESVTEQGLREKYALARAGAEKIKILVVPGHDQEYSGTEFGGIREIDLTLGAAQRLVSYLKQDPAFEVFVSQDENGYTPLFTDYFAKNQEAIRRFQIGSRAVMDAVTSAGLVDADTDAVFHPSAPKDYALRLYGISKWANENRADIVVHLHFNDYPRRKRSQPGRYSGFAIYTPDRQYSNSGASRALALSIAETLKTHFELSNFPREQEGVIDDQALIALGANNSLDPAAVLVEYGYIYEPQWQKPELRLPVLQEAAFQTYRGIQSFFARTAGTVQTQTSFLPYRWSADLRPGARGKDILALQAALVSEGLYPPSGSGAPCPLSGEFFACTRSAVRAFQQKYSLLGQDGIVDASTRGRLNELYGGSLSSP